MSQLDQQKHDRRILAIPAHLAYRSETSFPMSGTNRFNDPVHSNYHFPLRRSLLSRRSRTAQPGDHGPLQYHVAHPRSVLVHASRALLGNYAFLSRLCWCQMWENVGKGWCRKQLLDFPVCIPSSVVIPRIFVYSNLASQIVVTPL